MMMDGLMDGIKLFLNGVGIFFIIYLVGYSTFLFQAVVVGSSTLYQTRQQTRLKNLLEKNYYVPVTIIVPAYNEEHGIGVNTDEVGILGNVDPGGEGGPVSPAAKAPALYAGAGVRQVLPGGPDPF